MKSARAVNKNQMTTKLWNIIDEKYDGIAAKLARSVGMSTQSISHILRTKDKMPASLAMKLAKNNPSINIDKLAAWGVEVSEPVQYIIEKISAWGIIP